MNITTKSLFIILFFSILHLSAQSQTRGPGLSMQDMAEKDLIEMTNELSLTSKQVEDVTPIVYYYAQERIEIYDYYRFDPSKIKDELIKMYAKMDKELSKILTPEQMEKLKVMREAKMGVYGKPMRRQ